MTREPQPAGTKHPTWDTVAIVGVGLIGGSIGIDLLRRGLAKHVVGIGRREESLRAAREVGACTSTTVDLPRGLAERAPDYRVYAGRTNLRGCARGGRIRQDRRIDYAMSVAPRGRSSASSTASCRTRRITSAAIRWRAARRRARLRLWPACSRAHGGGHPARMTRAEDVQTIRAFWQSLGAKVLQMTPSEHDQLVAGASHLPHLVSAALVSATPPESLPLVAGGWIDTTRIAAGDAELWRDILLSNRANVLAALDRFDGELAKFRQALEQDDATGAGRHTSRRETDARCCGKLTSIRPPASPTGLLRRGGGSGRARADRCSWTPPSRTDT